MTNIILKNKEIKEKLCGKISQQSTIFFKKNYKVKILIRSIFKK